MIKALNFLDSEWSYDEYIRYTVMISVFFHHLYFSLLLPLRSVKMLQSSTMRLVCGRKLIEIVRGKVYREVKSKQFVNIYYLHNTIKC